MQILKRIFDSDDFGVGGGSTAALAGGMAASLAAMVAKLSTKKDYGLSPEECKRVAQEADKLSKILLAGSKEDAQAYAAVKKAFSLAKETEEDKAKRREAIEKSMIGAALVPKKNAWNCQKVQEICIALDGKSNPAAVSDLKVARYLADVGIIGCVFNIEANLSSIKNPDVAAELRKEAERLRGFVKLSL